MDIEKVYDLIERAEKSSFDKISIEMEDFKLCLERNCGTQIVREIQQSVMPPSQSTDAQTEQQATAAQPAEETGGDVITAPISGVFYVAKEPGAEPFAKVGDKVKKGQTVCIIEAMKMMNEIIAPKDGVIAHVLFEDAQPITANDILFRYAKDSEI